MSESGRRDIRAEWAAKNRERPPRQETAREWFGIPVGNPFGHDVPDEWEFNPVDWKPTHILFVIEEEGE